MRRHFFRVVEELLCASALTRPGSPYGLLEAVCPGGVGWVWGGSVILLNDHAHDSDNDDKRMMM